MDYTRLSSDGSLLQHKPQGFLAQNSNNVYPMFLFVEGINPSSYSCEAVFTPNGASSVTLIFPQTALEIDGATKIGYYLKLPDTVTKVSGAMAVNYVLKDLSGTVVFSQSISVYVNAAGGVEWDVPLIEAQYQEIIAQIIKSKAQSLGVVSSFVGSPLDGLRAEADAGFYCFVFEKTTYLLIVSASDSAGTAYQSAHSFVGGRPWSLWRSYSSSSWSDWSNERSYVESGEEPEGMVEGSSAIGKNSSATADNSVAVGLNSVSAIMGMVSFDSESENRDIGIYSLQRLFIRNGYLDADKHVKSAYADGHVLSDYIPNGTPVAVSIQWNTLVAGNSRYFSCSGSGTSIDPYVIKPTGTAAVPSARNIYYFSVPPDSPNIYIDFVGTTNEPCIVCVDNWDLPYPIHLTFSFLSKSTGQRACVNISDVPMTMLSSIVASGVYAMVDIDSPGVYQWSEI